MTSQVRSLIMRLTLASIAAMLGISLFFTGFWAGSARGGGEHSLIDPVAGSFWTYDPGTGNPRGPQGQLDFWNYDPQTGEHVADSSPGVEPHGLAALWGTSAK